MLYVEREMLSPCRAPECNPGFDRLRASHLLFSVLDHVDYHMSRVICWSCVCLSFLVDDFLLSGLDISRLSFVNNNILSIV